jgi:hypothetical protein
MPALAWRCWGKPWKISISIAGRRGRDLNPGPPEYEEGVLSTRLRRSVELKKSNPKKLRNHIRILWHFWGYRIWNIFRGVIYFSPCSKWASKFRYYIPELLFVPDFNTGTYQYIICPFLSFNFFFWRYILVSIYKFSFKTLVLERI